MHALDFFYSPLLKAVRNAKQKKAPAQDWLHILKAAPGVKQVEIDWMDLEGWLEDQDGQVTRDALEKFVAANQVQLSEIVNGKQKRRNSGMGPRPIWREPSMVTVKDHVDQNPRMFGKPDYSIIFPDVDLNDIGSIPQDQDLRGVLKSSDPKYPDFEGIRNRAANTWHFKGLPGSENPDEYQEIKLERAKDLAGQVWLEDRKKVIADVFAQVQAKDLNSEMETREEFALRLKEWRKINDPIDHYNDRLDELEAVQHITGTAIHSSYAEKGGANYKEFLITLPGLHRAGPNFTDGTALDQAAKNLVDHERIDPATFEGGAEAYSRVKQDLEEEVYWTKREYERKSKQPFVQGGHFTEDNIVVHVRSKDRDGPNGEKILFIEEFQSDLATAHREGEESPEISERRWNLEEALSHTEAALEQTDRKIEDLLDALKDVETNIYLKSYKPGEYQVEPWRISDLDGRAREHALERITHWDDEKWKAFRDLNGVHTDGYQCFASIIDDNGELLPEIKKKADIEAGLSEIRQKLLELGTAKIKDPSLPDTPFMEEQSYALAVKRMMRFAAEHGYDAVAWTPAWMQARRWGRDGDSVIEAIHWDSDKELLSAFHPDATRWVELKMGKDTRRLSLQVNSEGIIVGSVQSKETFEGAPLSKFIGKAMAEQITTEEKGTFPDLKLTLSSSGYAIGYDQQVKQSMNKLIKKHGGKVEWNASMPDFKRDNRTVEDLVKRLPYQEIEQRLRAGGRWDDDVMESLGLNDNLSDFRKKDFLISWFQRDYINSCFPEFVKSEPVHYVAITDKIRKACLEPLPMFREPDEETSIFVTQQGLKNLMGDLKARLAKLGIRNVDLRVDAEFEKQGVTHFFPDGDIEVLIGQTLNPEDTLNHETVHILRRRGLFTSLEWDALTAAAEESWIEKYNIAQRYGYLPRDLQIEEAIAEAYADYAAEHRNKSWIKRAFTKVSDFFVALGDTLMTSKVRRPDQIFGAIETGRIGRRVPDKTITLPNGIQELYQQPLDFFYSPLKKAVGGAKQKKAPAQDWKAIIAKLPGVKKKEVEFSGLDIWLDAKGKSQVTKDELLGFMELTQIRLVETKLQGHEDPQYEVSFNAGWELNNDEWQETFLYDMRGGPFPEHTVWHNHKSDMIKCDHPDFPDRENGIRRVDACAWADELIQKENELKGIDGPAQHGAYSLDGGQHYREILLQVPNLHEIGINKNTSIDKYAIRSRMHELSVKDREGTATEAERVEHDQCSALLAKSLDKHPFSSSHHFEEPNIVVHARLKDRIDIDGKRVLFVEEIQSDLSKQWAGQFDSPETIERRAFLKIQSGRLKSKIEQADHDCRQIAKDILTRPAFSKLSEPEKYRLSEYAVSNDDVDDLDLTNPQLERFLKVLRGDAAYNEAADRLKSAEEERSNVEREILEMGAERRQSSDVPHTPFLDKAATEIMLRRILHIAALEDYDSVSVTPGYIQSKRWSRSETETYTGLSWERIDDNEVKVRLVQDIGLFDLKVDKTGLIDEYTPLYRDSVPSYAGRNLQNLVGAKVFRQVMSQPSGEMSGPRNFSDTGFGIVYDQHIPSILNKIGSSNGAHVAYEGRLPDLEARQYEESDLFEDYSHEEMIRRISSLLGDEVIDQTRIEVRNHFGDMARHLEKQIAETEALLSEATSVSEERRLDSVMARAIRRLANTERDLEKLTIEHLFERISETPGMSVGEIFPETLGIKEGSKVHSIEMTPELKQAALAPQPMFRTFDGTLNKNINQDALEALLPRLRGRLDEIGQSHILLRADSNIGHQGVAGPMRNGDLGILIGKTAEPEDTLNHEIIHILRMQGLFTEPEWQTLSKAAMAKWIKQYNIERRYPLLSKDQQIEEAIAEAFADYAKESKPRSTLHRALLKIKSVFSAIRQAVRGVSILGPDSIFEEIEKGRLGRRLGNAQASALAMRASGTSIHIDGAEQSVIRTETGQLRRMYHGAVQDFPVFDPEKIRPDDYDAPFNGFWFSGDAETSPAMKGPNVIMPVYLNVTNPAPARVWRKVAEDVWDLDIEDLREEARSFGDEVRFRLEDMGYDGVIWDCAPEIDAEALARDGEVSFINSRNFLETLKWEKVRARGMIKETYEDTWFEVRNKKGELARTLRDHQVNSFAADLVILSDNINEDALREMMAFLKGDSDEEITLTVAEGNPLTFSKKTEMKETEYFGYLDEYVDVLMLYDGHGEHVTGYESLEDFLSFQDYTVVAFRPEQIISEFDPRVKRESLSLAARRPDLTEAPGFKTWFDLSYAVDHFGEPLVLFHHGSFDEDSDIPECPMHFGTEEAARMRASGKGADDAAMQVLTYQDEEGNWHWQAWDDYTSEDAGLPGFADEWTALEYGQSAAIKDHHEANFDCEDLGNMTAVYLSIQNPKRVLDQGNNWTDVIEAAKAEGYDGLVYRNKFEDVGSESWVAFYPDQIKSASWNNGSFDPNDPHLHFRQDDSLLATTTGSDKFKSWFRQSQILDELGHPRVVFNGANAHIDAFCHLKAQDRQGRQSALGLGRGKFYFSEDETVARSYSIYRGADEPIVLRVFLSVQKPMTSDEYQARYREISGGREIFQSYDADYDQYDRDTFIEMLDEQIQSEGYDGIVDDLGQIAVFSPTQIKSAYDNNGDFDLNDPRIRFRAQDMSLEDLRGETAVKDDNGEPLRLMHATFSNFEEFDERYADIGFHFGSPEAANKRIELKKNEEDLFGLGREKLGDPRIMPVYLNIKNPLRWPETRGGNWRPNSMMIAIRNGIYNDFDYPTVPIELTDDEIEEIFEGTIEVDGVPWEDASYEHPGGERGWMLSFLKARGYDGIVYDNEFEGGGDSYIAFEPDQIIPAFELKPERGMKM